VNVLADLRASSEKIVSDWRLINRKYPQLKEAGVVKGDPSTMFDQHAKALTAADEPLQAWFKALKAAFLAEQEVYKTLEDYSKHAGSYLHVKKAFEEFRRKSLLDEKTHQKWGFIVRDAVAKLGFKP
jgi:hypothetical protein